MPMRKSRDNLNNNPRGGVEEEVEEGYEGGIYGGCVASESEMRAENIYKVAAAGAGLDVPKTIPTNSGTSD